MNKRDAVLGHLSGRAGARLARAIAQAPTGADVGDAVDAIMASLADPWSSTPSRVGKSTGRRNFLSMRYSVW